MTVVVAPDIPGISGWEPLARGGFSTVWRARQEALDRPVAVKVDHRRLDSEAERRRFLGEAKAAGNLSGHPGIVTVHDAGILRDGRPYLVMKLCTGGLAHRLAAAGEPAEPRSGSARSASRSPTPSPWSTTRGCCTAT